MPASEFSDVFVSYRRLDVDFVKRLVEDLQKDGKEVWVDWEDIPPGVEGFADEIKRGLEGADTFIAVLTPNYLESTYCVDLELAYAAKLQKKIIPIVLKKFDDHQIPTSISHINWIYFTPHAGQDNTYEDSFPKILDVMHTDLEHVRQHKRFLLRAIEWDAGNKERSFLLNGEEIENAQGWLALSAGKEPIPTDLHRNYIAESVKLRKRQQQLLLGGVTVALVISIILAILSLIGFNDASIAQATALANLDIASTAQAEAEENELIASTARANAENSADIAQTAQAEAEENEALAHSARNESERNLQDARQSQALFHGDLAQQQANVGLHQRSLLLGLQALKFNADGITSNSAYMAVHNSLHQPIHRTLHLDFPKGILEVIWRDDYQQALIATDENTFITCPEVADCSPRVEVWDVLTQERVAYLAHDLAIQSVFWDQADNQVLTLSYDDALNQSIVTLWDVDTETKIYQLSQDHYTDWLIWEADSQYFITAEQSQFNCGFGDHPDCNYRTVVYKIATGEQVFITVPQEQEIVRADVSLDGQFVEVTYRQGRLNIPTVYNLITGEQVAVYDETSKAGVVWMADDTRIIALKDKALIAQDIATGDVLYSISSTGEYDVMGDMIIVATPNSNCKSADSCSELQVIDANTGEERFTTSHDNTADISLSAVIQDGKYLLVSTNDDATICPTCQTALYLWSLETGDLLHTFDYDGSIVTEAINYANGVVDLNADETLLLTLSLNDIEHYIVELWDIETGKSVAKVDLDRDYVKAVQFDNDNQHIIIHRDATIDIYDRLTIKPQHTLSHPSLLKDITILHDENRIATTSQTDFTLWEVVDWQPTLRNPIGFEINSEDQDYNQDSSQLLTWSDTDSLTPNAYVWDVETGVLLLTLETEGTVHHAAWSPNGQEIIVSQFGLNCETNCGYGILVFDAKTGERRASYEGVGGASFSWYPDINHIIYRRSDSIEVLDIKTGDIVYTSDVYLPSLRQWNREYTLFAIPNTEDLSYSLISYPSNDIHQTIQVSAPSFDMQWGNLDLTIALLVEGETSTDLVGYDVASGEEVYRIADAGIYEMSHDTTQLLMLTLDNQLQHIDVATGDILWTSQTLDQQWTDIIWSPDDSKVIISGFFTGQAEMYDIETGNVLQIFPYDDLRWSPDSRLILAFDDNVEPDMWRVYDIASSQVRFSFQPNSTPTWKHDSRALVSQDGRWSIDFGDLIQRGEAHRVRDLTELELLEFFIKPPPENVARPEHDDDDDD